MALFEIESKRQGNKLVGSIPTQGTMSDTSINICKGHIIHCQLEIVHSIDVKRRYYAIRDLDYWQARLNYLRAERRLARHLRSKNKYGKRTIPIDRVRVKAYLEMAESIRRRNWELERKALNPS